MIAAAKAPYIDWEALSPLVALAGGACIVLLVGLLRGRFMRRQVVPFLTLVVLGITAGACIAKWNTDTDVVSGALAIDDLTLTLTLVFVVAAAGAVLLSWRAGGSAEAGGGEYYGLLLGPGRGVGRGGRGRVLRAAAELGARHGPPRRRREPRRGVPGVRAVVDPAVSAVR